MYYTFWMLHQEKTFRFVLTFNRQATDRSPTHYQLLADCRSTVGRQVGYISGKTCWLSVGRLPTDDQQSVDCRSTDGRKLADSRPTGFLGSSSSQLPRFVRKEPCCYFKNLYKIYHCVATAIN